LSQDRFYLNILQEGCVSFTSIPEIKLEPQNRCATLIIYDTKLVILPFKQEKSVLEFSQDERFLMDEEEQQDKEKKSEEKRDESPVKRQVIIDLKKLGLQNIKDYCFLYGYNDPTILFLHETEQTWCGRLATKRNTSTCTAISFDLSKILTASANFTPVNLTHFPIIWSVSKLYHDSYMLVPLKEAIGGGALVVGMNGIVHVNQRAHYGLSLNDFCVNDPEAAIQTPDKSPHTLFFDTSAFLFLAKNRILFSLKNGDLYVLHLFHAGSAVRKILLSKTKTSVPASCICGLTNYFMFLGSRLGDSLLVYFTEKKQEMNKEENLEPDRKRRKLTETTYERPLQTVTGLDDEFLQALEMEDTSVSTVTNSVGVNQADDQLLTINESDDFLDKIAENEDDDDDDGIAFLQLETENEAILQTKLVHYELAVRDTIKNIGPITNLIIADTSITDAFSTSQVNNNNLEIVACSGHGKNGHISLIQRNLRPEINSNSTLPFAVKEMWTLKSKNGSPDADDVYLVLALDNSTKILQSGRGLDEITDKTDFFTNDTTVNISNIIGNTYILQICPTKAKLLDGHSKTVRKLSFDSEVRSSCVVDPFALVHFVDGTLALLEAKFDESSGQGHLELIRPSSLNHVRMK
jgi:cleavage and polyadenylation specificity factor subunit 1